MFIILLLIAASPLMFMLCYAGYLYDKELKAYKEERRLYLEEKKRYKKALQEYNSTIRSTFVNPHGSYGWCQLSEEEKAKELDKR